jgi:hypothetical protein
MKALQSFKMLTAAHPTIYSHIPTDVNIHDIKFCHKFSTSSSQAHPQPQTQVSTSTAIL